MIDYFDFSGKRAIVTGATRGLGLGMSEALLERGCTVCMIGSSDRIHKAASSMQEKGYKAIPIQGDLGDRKALNDMFQHAMTEMGGIDILVNAAGIQRRHPSEDFPLEDWDAVMRVNLDAVFILCQLAAREMIKQGRGKIINIASMVSWFGGVTVPAYTASKGAVTQMTKAFANDWGAKGINVNALAPGYMLTEMTQPVFDNPTRNEGITARIPMKRWGSPEDMKGPALFLASSASDYLNGAIIPVDGGYLCM